MNRCRFGAALLIGLLALGLFSNLWAFRRYSSLAEELTRVETLALEQDWEASSGIAEGAEEVWRKYRPVTAALVDHETVLRVDSLFRQLRFALGQKNMDNVGDLCAQICQELEAMAGEHSLSWENIL